MSFSNNIEIVLSKLHISSLMISRSNSVVDREFKLYRSSKASRCFCRSLMALMLPHSLLINNFNSTQLEPGVRTYSFPLIFLPPLNISVNASCFAAIYLYIRFEFACKLVHPVHNNEAHSLSAASLLWDAFHHLFIYNDIVCIHFKFLHYYILFIFTLQRELF